MKRIQGVYGARDPDEEKKRSRESVLANVVIYGSLCLLIRSAPYIIHNFF